MNKYRFSLLEWCVAAGVVLLGTVNSLPDDLLGSCAAWFRFVFKLLYEAVILWALFCMYRKARYEDRKHGVIMLFMIVTFLLYLNGLLLRVVPGGAGHPSNLMMLVMGLLGFLLLVVGIVLVVRLFKDRVRPLGTIMVLYVMLPFLFGILAPLLSMMANPVVPILTDLIQAVVVALMFLFRNAEGISLDDDYNID